MTSEDMTSKDITSEEIEITWLDHHQTLTFDDLIALSNLSKSELLQLIENGVLTPNPLINPVQTMQNLNDQSPFSQNDDIQHLTSLHFTSHHLVLIRTLGRLKQDFELENNSLSLIMLFLERIRLLETQLQQLNKQKD